MRPIVTDVPWSVCLRVCVSVSLVVTNMSCSKTAERNEMPFGMWTRGDISNRALGGAGSPQKDAA